MKKIVTILLCFLFIFICSCKKPEQTVQPNSEDVIFVDALGRSVCIKKDVKRVAALLGSFAEIWTLAGGNVIASADDAWDDFDIDMPDNAVNLGGTKTLSLEKLFSADPDFILASSKTAINVEWREILEKAGIAVAYFDVSDFNDYLNMLDICTDITGRKDLYKINGTDILMQIEEVRKISKSRIQNELEAQRVLFLRASAGSIRAKNSRDSVLGEMLHDLGCINIADNDGSLLENLSIERIITEDPDRIFIVQVGDNLEAVQAHVNNLFASNGAWRELKAVRTGNVHFMDKKLYNLKPNDRWGEAYEKLEEILSGKIE